MIYKNRAIQLGAIAAYLGEALTAYGYKTNVTWDPDDDDLSINVLDCDEDDAYAGYVGWDECGEEDGTGCYTLINMLPRIYGVEHYHSGADVVLQIMRLIDEDIADEFTQWIDLSLK